MFRLIYSTFLMGVLAVIGLVSFFFYWENQPINIPTNTEILIPKGSSVVSIAHILEEKKVITSAFLFRMSVRIHGADRKLKPGTYQFSDPSNPKDVLTKIISGIIELVEFSHPPGFNKYQVAQKLAETFPETSSDDWHKIFQSENILKLLPEGVTSVEGYLFPDTYKVHKESTSEEIVSLMIQTYRKKMTSEILNKARIFGLTEHQLITLASIIEKETGIPEERQEISAVFHNRLKQNMKLQTDPTIIYGIWERYDGNIRKKDLEEATPYNTYVIPGLPPGPIANPSLESIKAAISPNISKNLYFVSKNDGSHYFSRTYEEHLRAVRKYQLRKR